MKKKITYFDNFGLKQICDIAMIVGAILLIVGLSISGANLKAAEIVLIVGFGVYIVACGLAIFNAVKVLTSGINHRSPEYKRAVVNTVIMSVIVAVAIFGLIYLIVA